MGLFVERLVIPRLLSCGCVILSLVNRGASCLRLVLTSYSFQVVPSSLDRLVSDLYGFLKFGTLYVNSWQCGFTFLP